MIMMSVWSDIWNGIVAGLNWLLQALYGLTGNYGVAVILLTLLVKVILLPLTIKQTRSMVAMQKVQPEIKKLQEKYKDDKEKLSQEMMKFYKENKVNPLGGCLPLLLQLPVFFALFTVLRKYLLTPPAAILGNTYTVFKHLPWYAGKLAGPYASLPVIKPAGFLWIKNLADTTRIADPTFILVILLAASTWYSQKQVMTDPRQKNMMIIMPLITAFIGFSLPAGVAIYWLTTNVLQIIQQFAMEYYDQKHPREVPKGKEAKKAAPEKAAAKGLSDKAPASSSRGKAASKAGAPARGGGTASAGGGGAKRPKAAAAGQKGKAPAKQKTPAPKGAKQSSGAKPSSQARRPKGPPPQQKKPQKGAGGGGSARKKR